MDCICICIPRRTGRSQPARCDVSRDATHHTAGWGEAFRIKKRAQRDPTGRSQPARWQAVSHTTPQAEQMRTGEQKRAARIVRRAYRAIQYSIL